jgi:hypothetical protein
MVSLSKIYAQRRKREQRKQQGICSHCGVRKAELNKSNCSYCIERRKNAK